MLVGRNDMLQALDREAALGERSVHCRRAHISLHRSPCIRLPYGFGGVEQPNVIIDSLLNAFIALWGDGAYPRKEDHDPDELGRPSCGRTVRGYV